jgi:preprotein translocase subunit SecA
MFGILARKIFGSKNERELKKIQPVVAQIASFEPSLKTFSDSDLQQYHRLADKLLENPRVAS